MDSMQAILVVEDEPLVRMSLVDTLESGGFTVAECASGSEAIGFIDNVEHLLGVITDIRLGEGPNGWEVAHYARCKFASIPIIYVSGDSASDWTVHGVPGSTMLQKPYAEAQVLTAMSTLVTEAGLQPQASNPVGD